MSQDSEPAPPRAPRAGWFRRFHSKRPKEAGPPAQPAGPADLEAVFERELARALAGVSDAEVAASTGAALDEESFWAVVERLAESVARDAWDLVTPRLVAIRVVRRERRRLRHFSAWARAIAARRLGLLHDLESVAGLRRVMTRGPRLVTLTAALALARIGDLEALAWLLEHPSATSRLGRHQLVALLKRFGPEGAALLGEAIRGWEVEAPVHVAAIEVLGACGESSALEPLLRLLREGRPEARVAAARALGGVGEPAAAAPLIEALDDYRWAVRAQAARSLGELGAVQASPRLAARLSDPVWWVRHHAGYALTRLGREGRLTLEAVARARRDPFAADMAEEALEALDWGRGISAPEDRDVA